jgi:hypothetical protein
MALNRAWRNCHKIPLKGRFLKAYRSRTLWFTALVISLLQGAIAAPDYSDTSCPYYSEVLRSLPGFAANTPLQPAEAFNLPHALSRPRLLVPTTRECPMTRRRRILRSRAPPSPAVHQGPPVPCHGGKMGHGQDSLHLA